MKLAEDIKRLIKNLHDKTSTQMDERVLKDVLCALEETEKTSAVIEPKIRNIIMKSPITKLAVAAIIIVVAILGLFELIDTDSKSGLVWAEVAQRVEDSPGVIFRIRETGSGDPNEQWPNAHRIIQRNKTLSRLDWYRGDEIRRTVYFDLDSKTEIWIGHDKSVYSRQTMSDEKIQKMRAGGLGWSDPQGLLNLGRSLEHHALGQKTIDSVLCEGIEATGPKGYTGRAWISVESGYPVLIEIERIVDGNIRHTGMMDKFQWNVELSPEDVEPEIPTDYEPLQ